MKLNGTHKFKASSSQVFNAVLNPAVLKSCIPGCESVEYLDADTIRVSLTTPLPGLKGPYGIPITIIQRQEPNFFEFQVQRKIAGASVNATGKINLTDEPGGALLAYNAHAELTGAAAIANNLLGERTIKGSLSSFFKNLDAAIAK